MCYHLIKDLLQQCPRPTRNCTCTQNLFPFFLAGIFIARPVSHPVLSQSSWLVWSLQGLSHTFQSFSSLLVWHGLCKDRLTHSSPFPVFLAGMVFARSVSHTPVLFQSSWLVWVLQGLSHTLRSFSSLLG